MTSAARSTIARQIHEVFDKLPDEHSIRAIVLDEELNRERGPGGAAGRHTCATCRARGLGVLLAALGAARARRGGSRERYLCREPDHRRRTLTRPSGPGVAVSADGRYVVFESTADNPSDVDNDSVVNIYVRDRQAGTTELVSRASGAAGAGADATRRTRRSLLAVGTSRSSRARRTSATPTMTSTSTCATLEADTTTLVSTGADGDSGDPRCPGRRLRRVRVARHQPQRPGQRRRHGRVQVRPDAGTTAP